MLFHISDVEFLWVHHFFSIAVKVKPACLPTSWLVDKLQFECCMNDIVNECICLEVNIYRIKQTTHSNCFPVGEGMFAAAVNE